MIGAAWAPAAGRFTMKSERLEKYLVHRLLVDRLCARAVVATAGAAGAAGAASIDSIYVIGVFAVRGVKVDVPY